MHTNQQQQTEINNDGFRVVDAAEAQAAYERNAFIELAKRRAKVIRRQAERDEKEAKRLAVLDRLEAERKAATSTSHVFIQPKPVFKGIVMSASQAEIERQRYENTAREEERVRTKCRNDAERVYHELVDFLRMNPTMSEEQIVREFKGALFMPVEGVEGKFSCEHMTIHLDEVARIARWEAHDAKKLALKAIANTTDYVRKLAIVAEANFFTAGEDHRGNPVFERDGVSLTLYGSGVSSSTGAKHFSKNLNPEQQRAAERRAQGGKFNTSREVLGLMGIGGGKEKKPRGTPGMTPDELAKAQAKNAELRAKGKADRKKAKAPVVKTPKADKKAKKNEKKGGKQ